MNVIVIGSGLAGTLVCNELVKKHSVTLLETGPKEGVEYPKLSFLKKQLAGVKTFCFGGGGTTNLWHNGLIPIQQQDVTSKDFRSVLEQTEQYRDKAAKNLFWLDNPYMSTYRKVFSEISSFVQKIGCFSDGVDCLLYPKKYSPLKVVPEVNGIYSVSGIEFKMEGNKVVGIDYHVGKKTYFIETDCVIVCAGSFGTPLIIKKILAGMGQPSKSAGVGLADHPLGFVGKVKVKKTFNKEMKQLSVKDFGNFECRTGIRVKSNCGKYTGCAFLRPALTMENTLSIYKYKSLLGASSGVERLKNIFSWKLFHPDILAEIVSHLFGITIPGRLYNILFLFEQKRGDSHVNQNDSGFEIDWSITPKELEIYKGMVDKLEVMLYGIADDINIEKDITDDWLWSAAHHSGTISMGQGSGELVDMELKLKASDNVFVCDGSIVQEHSYANTGLTIGALAMGLADKINNEK